MFKPAMMVKILKKLRAFITLPLLGRCDASYQGRSSGNYEILLGRGCSWC
ncbi:hypothetical protein MANES_18G061650v8 [Manihot esculenta]|uniref:Uncharacterized protein n=1 Tax=Manihot esculenta TaxID=3983 RepID=A0A2C9U129_MANES|nr:hypothetical protein MANES_18G061650v8 [Manihot esculenta]